MSTLLEARDVSKVYQMGTTRVAALDRVSVGVKAGEFVAIQGTSGSGKSTLLNVLGGLDHPTDGEILFDSKPLAPMSKKAMARYRRNSVGMIFQGFNLIPTMSAEEKCKPRAGVCGRAWKPAQKACTGITGTSGLGRSPDPPTCGTLWR